MESSKVHSAPKVAQESHDSKGGASLAPPAFSLGAGPLQKKSSEVGSGASMVAALQRKSDSSFPEGAEKAIQKKDAGSGSSAGSQMKAGTGGTAQMKGGPTAGTLCINSNAVGEGLTAGHAWLSYQPVGGAMTTYGTWGNVEPYGLHRDRELGNSPKAKRCTDIDAADVTKLDSFATSNNSWSYMNNCASFAARGWLAVTGESIPYTTIGIPNPSALGKGIVAKGGVLAAGAGGGSSASSGSSYGSSSISSIKP
jgi:hypothetical protein